MDPSHFQMDKYSCIKWNWIALISRISHQIGVRHILRKSIDLLCILQRRYSSWGMEPYITFSVERFQGQVRLQMKLGYSRPAFSYWVTAHGVKIDNSPSHVTSHTIVSTRLLSSSANTYTLVIYLTGFSSVVIISHTSVIIIHPGHHHNSVTINNLPSHHCFKYFSHHQHHQTM